MNFPNVIDKSKMGDYVHVHYYSSYHETKILIEAKVRGKLYKFLVPAGDRYHKSSYDNFNKLDFFESAALLTTH